MPGQVKKILDSIVLIRSQGDDIRALTTTTKLILKGLDPAKFTTTAPDEPETLARARAAAVDLGVTLP